MASNKKYECLVETDERTLTVVVFTPSSDKQIIRELAIDRAKEFMDELGVTSSSIKPIGFRLAKDFNDF